MLGFETYFSKFTQVNEYFEMPIRWSVIDRSERNQLKFYLRSLSLKIIQFLRVTGFCDIARKVFSFLPFVVLAEQIKADDKIRKSAKMSKGKKS